MKPDEGEPFIGMGTYCPIIEKVKRVEPPLLYNLANNNKYPCKKACSF
jgi:hypothetical protein